MLPLTIWYGVSALWMQSYGTKFLKRNYFLEFLLSRTMYAGYRRFQKAKLFGATLPFSHYFYLKERNQLSKYEPNINHLHIGSLGESAWHADEEGGQDQLGCQVDSHHGFEEEILEEVCCVHDGEDEEWRKVGCQELVQDPSLQHHRHNNTFTWVSYGIFGLF